MFWLEGLLNRKIIVGLMVVLIIMLGVFSINKLSVEMLPQVMEDGATIYVAAGDMSALDVETAIAVPIENVIRSIQGVHRYTSYTQTGRTYVVVYFDKGKGEEVFPKLETEVRAIESQLHGAERMTIRQWSTVYEYDLHLDLYAGDMAEMTNFAFNTLKPRLESLPEVREVSVFGYDRHEIIVELEQGKMAELGIDALSVVQLFNQQNQNVTLGEIEDNEQNLVLRWDTRMTTLEDIKQLHIPANNSFIELEDISNIEYKQLENNQLRWRNGDKNYLSVNIGRVPAVTGLQMTQVVRKEIEQMQQEGLISEYQLEELFSRDDFIRTNISEVRNNVILGAVLAFAVLLLFLRNIRATLIISISIPISILLTFSLMWLFDYSINIISVVALGLGIGMIVDSSIVILEAIYRNREMGFNRIQAAIRGTKEVSTAVLASMLTTIVVFLPVGLVSGEIGVFVLILSLVVVITLVSSVLVAFTVIPVMSVSFLKVKKKSSDQKENVILLSYEKMLKWMLSRVWKRWSIIFIFILLFASAIPVLLYKIPMGFMPDVFNRQSEIGVNLDSGVTNKEIEIIAEEMHQRLQVIPDVQSYNIEAWNEHMWIFVNMTKGEEQTLTQAEVNEKLFSTLRDMRGEYPITEVYYSVEGGSSHGSPIVLRFSGEDYGVLQGLAEDLSKRMLAVEGINSVIHSLQESHTESFLVLDYDELAKYYLTPEQLKSQIEILFLRYPIGHLQLNSQEVPIILSLNHDVDNLAALHEHEIYTPAGLVQLSQFASFEKKAFPTEIVREKGERIITLSAHNEGRDLGAISRDLQNLIKEMDIPAGYSITLGGQLEQQQETNMEMLLVLLIALFLVFVVMAIQFNNLIHPLIVMTAIPLSIIGVTIGLFVTQRELNIMTTMGIIMLIGIVLNNAILLIDRTKQLRLESLQPKLALIEAGKNRLRPIFLTTFTTVFGILPLSFATGNGSNFQAPMATAVISGLLFSTLVTLIMIPAVYMIVEDIKGLFKRKKKVKETELNA